MPSTVKLGRFFFFIFETISNLTELYYYYIYCLLESHQVRFISKRHIVLQAEKSIQNYLKIIDQTIFIQLHNLTTIFSIDVRAHLDTHNRNTASALKRSR